MATIAIHPDWQRRTPVALAANGPVDVVRQPVTEASITDMLRDPVNLLIVGNEITLKGGGADIPGALRVEEQRCATAPAEGVVVLHPPTLEQKTTLLQMAGDLGIGQFEKFASKGKVAQLRHDHAVQIDREERR